MKQKAKRDPRNKLKLEKKNVDLCLLNDITNTIFFNHESQNKKENTTKNNENRSKSKPKYKNKNKNKIQYDPIIFRMIQSHNRKKWNSNIVYIVSEFLTFEENLSLRLVCKLFNNGIEKRYQFLKENIVFTNNNKIHEKIRKEYKINNKKKNILLFNEIVEGDNKKKLTKKEKEINALLLNKRQSVNFSKKQMLINMINNKDFISIKSRIKSGELSVPHNLCV